MIENKQTKVNYNRVLKNKKIPLIVFTAVIIAVLLYIRLNSPFKNNTICPSVNIFNIYCSACGIVRATYMLLTFNIVAAFKLNCFFVLSLPFLAIIYIAVVLNVFWGKNILKKIKHKKIIIALYLFLFLLFGILRNFKTFEFLAPALSILL